MKHKNINEKKILTTSDQNEESIHPHGIQHRKLDSIKKVYRNSYNARETINRYHQCFHTKYLVFALQAVAVKISAVVFCCYLTSFCILFTLHLLHPILSYNQTSYVKMCFKSLRRSLHTTCDFFKVNISIFTKYVTNGYEMSNDVAIY